MKTKTNVKAGGVDFNHNQTQVASTPLRTLRTKPDDEGDHHTLNHNQTQLRRRSLRVKTGVKAGPIIRSEGPGGGN